MKRLLVLAGIASLAGTAASATDLPVKAPVYKAPPPIVSPLWTGPYLGLNLGYSWGRSSTDIAITTAATGALIGSSSGTIDLDGVIGGGQIGYNWQMSNLVVGIEADIQATGQKGSLNFTCAGCGNGPADINTSLDQKLTWLGTLRGRVGVTMTPTMLAYVTGGLAYGEIKTDGTVQAPLRTVHRRARRSATAARKRAGQ